MAMHANTPDDCLLVRHWVLLGEKSIPKESRWALGTHGLPQERLNGCGMWAVGGQRPKYLLCLARSIQRRCCCGCWHAQGLGGWGGNPWEGGRAAAPPAAHSCLRPCHPGEIRFNNAGAFSVPELAAPLGRM